MGYSPGVAKLDATERSIVSIASGRIDSSEEVSSFPGLSSYKNFRDCKEKPGNLSLSSHS